MKIKVIKTEKDLGGRCYECGGSDPAYQGVTKWDEIDQKQYSKLYNAVSEANKNQKDKFYYAIIQQVEDVQEIFDSADQYIEFAEKQQKQREKAATDYKLKLEQNKIERKKKQFEKLEKELKNFNSAI